MLKEFASTIIAAKNVQDLSIKGIDLGTEKVCKAEFDRARVGRNIEDFRIELRPEAAAGNGFEHKIRLLSEARNILNFPERSRTEISQRLTSVSQSELFNSFEDLKDQLKNFKEKVVGRAKAFQEGAEKNFEEAKKQRNESGFLEGMSGIGDVRRKEYKASEKDLEDRTKHHNKVKDLYDSAEQKIEMVSWYLNRAKEFESKYPEIADRMRDKASKLISETIDSLDGVSGVDRQATEALKKSLQEISKLCGNVSENMDKVADSLNTIKEAAHLVGVGVGQALGGPAGAALVNFGLRMLESAAEGAGNLMVGGKTLEEVTNDFADAWLEAIIESGATAAGGSLAGKLGQLTKVIGSKSVQIAKMLEVIAQAVGTGAISTGKETVTKVIELIKAEAEFSVTNPELTGRARSEAYDKFMKDRGLSVADITKELVTCFLASSAGKASGSSLSPKMREALSKEAEVVTAELLKKFSEGGDISIIEIVSKVLGGKVAGKTGNQASSKAA